MARGGSGDGGGSGDSSARDAPRAELATEHVGGGHFLRTTGERTTCGSAPKSRSITEEK